VVLEGTSRAFDQRVNLRVCSQVDDCVYRANFCTTYHAIARLGISGEISTNGWECSRPGIRSDINADDVMAGANQRYAKVRANLPRGSGDQHPHLVVSCSTEQSM